MKTIELSNTGLVPLAGAEAQRVQGGDTTFIYDLGTLLRAHAQATAGNIAGLAQTAFTWFAQQ